MAKNMYQKRKGRQEKNSIKNGDEEKFLKIYEYLKKQELYENNFCMTCKEMEETEEFNLKDYKYIHNKK